LLVRGAAGVIRGSGGWLIEGNGWGRLVGPNGEGIFDQVKRMCESPA
jgi:hypothetical protein